MFWRQVGGHLRKVETCNSGVTWGIAYDNTPWVYTGGWGGTFLKGMILFFVCLIVKSFFEHLLIFYRLRF